MATKKKKSPKSPSGPISAESALRDLRKMLEGKNFDSIEDANAFLSSLSGAPIPHSAPALPKDQAQELALEAMSATTALSARKLALQALKLDPDCVDALVLMVDLEAETADAAINGIKNAVAAGERSLGKAFFEEYKGHFWLALETRPYMRARMRLAEILRDAMRLDEAITHFEALLELCPNDNLGARDPLLALYLHQGRIDAAGRLLREFEDDRSAVHIWGHTLERYLSGDILEASLALRRALAMNPNMLEYLFGLKSIPNQLPDSYSPGSPEEAMIAAHHLLPAWVTHQTAFQWMLNETRLALAGVPKKKTSKKRPLVN